MNEENAVSGAHPASGAGTDDAPGATPPQAASPPQPSADAPDASPNDDAANTRQGEGITAEIINKAKQEASEETEPRVDLALRVPMEGKPDKLPEQFWDAEKNELKVESLAKSWSDRGQEIKELRAQGKEAPPESPSDYKFEVPEDAPYELDVENDPGLKIAMDVAHKAGLNQKQFETYIHEFMSKMEAEGFTQKPIDTAAEFKKLGENGIKIAEAVANFGLKKMQDGLFSERELEEFSIMTATAEGTNVMRKIMEDVGVMGRIPTREFTEGENLPSQQEWYEMTQNDKYYNDAAYRKKVDKIGERVNGMHASGESARGLGVN